MSNKTIQYQQNIDIIKNFFRKPVVLVAGILTIIASVVNSVMNYISVHTFNDIANNFLADFGFQNSIATDGAGIFFPDIFAIGIGVALILLFAFGRSRSNAIQGGITFFRVMAHIYYVAYFIVAVCAALIVIFAFAMEVDTLVKIILIVSFLAIGVFVLLFGYSMLQFAKSAKESMNSIYLSNSGAKVHGIMRIISAVAMSLIAVFNFFLILSWGRFNPMWIAVYSLVPVALMIAKEILWAVFALKYHRYINGVVSGKIEMPMDKDDDEEKICIVCGCPLTDEDIYCSVCGTKVE